MKMKLRTVLKELKEKQQSKLGRIIVLTGARQTGKTTIAKHCFKDYYYIAVDDVVKIRNFVKLTSEQWANNFPLAVLDEVQCVPQLIHSIKATYDQFDHTRYILLGSSQFLLLEKIRESLAGRCVIFEIYPLTLPELLSVDINEEELCSFFVDFVNDKQKVNNLFPSFIMDNNYAIKKNAYDYYLRFGGYPALTDLDLTDSEREEWLSMYVRTFLERDIRDLISFRDLTPFVKLQQYMAHISGMLVNFSSVAKETAVSVPTVQRYIRYMDISYQSITLPAWFANPLKKLVRAPKVHFLDPGVLRAVLHKYKSNLTGNEFESAMVAEIYKQIKTHKLPLTCYHLRTKDGREVDMLLEAADYYIAIEIKMSEHINHKDISHLKDLQNILNKPLKHAFVLSNDVEVKHFGENITAMHAAAFLT
jgi:predicted AAA+ superfamily ATPase